MVLLEFQLFIWHFLASMGPKIMTSPQAKNHLLYEVLAPKILTHIDEFILPIHGRVGFMRAEISRDGKYLDLFFTGSPFTKTLRQALSNMVPSLKSHLASVKIFARMPTLRILEQKNTVDVLDILADIRRETLSSGDHEAQ
jgi:hypothetical protein